MFNVGVIEAAATLDDSEYRRKLLAMPSMAKGVFAKIAGLAAGYLSFRGLASGLQASLDAWQVQEDAVDDLDDALALKNAGEFSASLQKFAAEMEALTTFGDEGTLAVMALGINMGIQADKMEDAAKAAIGLASAYDMDLRTAMQLIAKANAGQTGTLMRYGIVLDQTKSKQEQFNELLEKGAASLPLAEADTLSAEIAQIGNAWGSIKEFVGQFVSELFDATEAADALAKKFQETADYMMERKDEWVIDIGTAYYTTEAAVKKTWALIEPLATLVTQSISSAMYNVVRVGYWAFDNFGAIWGNMPDIFIGIGKDILEFFRNLFRGLLDLAVNLGKAVWQAIKGGGASGFRDMADRLVADALATVADIGKETGKALEKAGVTPFPELQSPDFAAMVGKYSRLGEEFTRIDEERARKQAEFEARYAAKVEAKKDRKKPGATGPEAERAEDVAGSFSAAILDAMLGAGTPEKETAKNTKEMVVQLKRVNERLAYVGVDEYE
jgi:hypothetical protein